MAMVRKIGFGEGLFGRVKWGWLVAKMKEGWHWGLPLRRIRVRFIAIQVRHELLPLVHSLAASIKHDLVHQ
jgi:hypothetical protein